MKTHHSDCPRRLVDEAILLNKKEAPAWTARRANKMRERFDTIETEPFDALSLMSPVQPSPRSGTSTGAIF